MRDGRVIFWSGNVEDNGTGPVDPGAHFYRSYQLDGEATPSTSATPGRRAACSMCA